MAKHFGVAETDIDEEKYGGLYSAIRQIAQSDEGAAAAIAAAEAMSPATEKVDAAQLAIRFFSQMGANAAQPGSTALSAAASALPSAANYLAEVNKRNRELERARGPLAIQLATAMKPPTSGTTTLKSVIVTKPNGETYEDFISVADILALQNKGFKVKADDTTKSSKEILKPFAVNEINKEKIEEVIGRPVSIDSLGNALLTDIESVSVSQFLTSEVTPAKTYAQKYEQGNRVKYMTEENAIKTLEEYGVKSGDVEYNELFQLITTDDDEQIGKPIIEAESYVSWFFPRDSRSDLRINIRTPSGSETPSEVIYRRKEIDKLTKIELDQSQVANELFPVLDSAMQLLLNDKDHDITGGFQATTVPIRNFLTSAFGIPSSDLVEQKYLEALSNQLGPKMRPVGSGSTSDMEFKAYKQAILSLDQPAMANYLTMYSLFQRTKNAQKELQLRKQLIYQGKGQKYIQGKLDGLDKGIYEKFTSFAIDLDADTATNTARYIQERKNWFDSLPNGAVVLNAQDSKTGIKIFPNKDTFIIKGW